MRHLVAAEWFKIRKRRLPWILAGCLIGIISVLYGILLLALSTAASDETFSQELANSLQVRNTVRFGDGIVYRIVALLSLILAATVTANEYHWRTVVMRVSWTGEKVKPFVASLVVISALSIVGLALGYATTVIAVIAVGAVRGTLASGDLGVWLAFDAGLAILRSGPAVFVFIAGAAAIAAWTKSTAAGIAIPLGVLFLEPLGAAVFASSAALDGVMPIMLSRNIDALLAANGEVIGSATELPAELPSAWLAAAFLLFYAGVTVVVAARLVSRREVSD